MLTLLATLALPAQADTLDVGILTEPASTSDVRWGPPPPPPPRRPPPRPGRVERMQVEEPTRTFSLTVSAVDLALGMGDVTGEFRLDPKDSLALSGGLGMSDEGLLYRVGLEGRRYVAGDFDTGVFVGLGVDGGDARLFLPVDDGFGIGPTIGAKVTVPVVPFTLEAKAGGQVVLATDYVAIAPVLDVGLGFSF